MSKPTAMLSVLALAALLSACAADTSDVERGPLGKADAYGSCAESDCDGQSADGNCWCDHECVEFGDCCADRQDFCTADLACGTTPGLECDPGMFCDYGDDGTCGADGELGTCRPLSEFCPDVYQPVCGCNGQTYSNGCYAHAAGASIAHAGSCEQAQVCDGFAGLGCPEGEFCRYEVASECGTTDQGGTCAPVPQACPQVYEPVCGCDGETYTSECDANAAGVSIWTEGPCRSN